MNVANCRLMGLALRPQLPPLDVKSVIIIRIIIVYEYIRMILSSELTCSTLAIGVF